MRFGVVLFQWEMLEGGCMDTRFAVQSFVTLLVITDPIGNIPTFLGVSTGRSVAARARLAGEAVLVASGVIGVFAAFGRQILDYLGITLPALQVSGGLLLLLVSLQLLTGKQTSVGAGEGVNVALVPLATPLIAGPGAIAVVLVFAREVHTTSAGVLLGGAIAAVMLVLYVVLRFSAHLERILREGGIELLTRVFGLLLAAIAVQLGFAGIRGFGL
ncbi:MAG: MarC family protein [Ferrimicrobium sp.]